jgi:hypothetical protein
MECGGVQAEFSLPFCGATGPGGGVMGRSWSDTRIGAERVEVKNKLYIRLSLSLGEGRRSPGTWKPFLCGGVTTTVGRYRARTGVAVGSSY